MNFFLQLFLAVGAWASMKTTIPVSYVYKITATQTGGYDFASYSSERKSGNLSAGLSVYNQETGVLSYGKSRTGMVVAFEFTGAQVNATRTTDMYLHVTWNATGSYNWPNMTAILQVEQTSCYEQSREMNVYWGGCTSSNTRISADYPCYCGQSACASGKIIQTTLRCQKLTPKGKPDTTPILLKAFPKYTQDMIQSIILRPGYGITREQQAVVPFTISSAVIKLVPKKNKPVLTPLSCPTPVADMC